MNNGCPAHGWSVIGSASLDSQLAGVLAGFVFTGIVLLFGRSGSKNTQALALFCVTFVALGIDSHLFTVISGESPEPFCSRVWTEEMVSAGLLGMSAMAIVTGLSWLLASHIDETTRPQKRQDLNDTNKVIKLDRLIPLIVYGTGAIITLLVANITYDYLSIIYTAHIPTILAVMSLFSPVFVLVVSAGLALAGAWRAHRNPGVTRTGNANSGLKVAVYGILCYAVAGSIFFGLVGEIGTADLWRSLPGGIVVATMIVGLGVPALLVIALVQAIPPLSPKTST
jgi:hypothetical protein